jgi:sulfur-oxidizing protein SoxA
MMPKTIPVSPGKPIALVVVSCLLAAATLTAGAAEKAKTEKAKKAEPAAIDTKMVAYKEPWKRYGKWPQTDWKEYNNLVNASVSPPPLTQPVAVSTVEGDAAKGLEISKRRGSCMTCHVMGDKSDQSGNIGPDLSLVATYRDDTYLYNYVNDPRVYTPMSGMPPWGTNKLLTEEEMKDVVAFMRTLKTPAVFKNPALDDPNKRPAPQETRDNLDATENPGMFSVDEGKALFEKKGSSGKACISCHEKPQEKYKTWAATMPKWEPRMKKVMTVEEFVARHAKATTGAELLMETQPNIDMAIYLRHLANGAPVKVDVASADAKAAYERGKALTAKKLGQQNFSCNDCHETGAGRWVRGQYLAAYKGAFTHFPTFRTSQGEAWDMPRRMQWCNVAIRANELPPDAPEYGELQLFLAAQNEGLPLSVPGIRH